MARIDIRGKLIPNDYKWFYDYFEEDSTCPKDVKKILDAAAEGEGLEVYVNSPGGVISVGSEIYTLLRAAKESRGLKIYITGEACSAASVIAMAGYCEMSPTALMMVHCVSTLASGNHAAMEHTAEVLRIADRALCTAYMEKSGMTEQEALEMMERETWLTAQRAVDCGLVDAVMFEETGAGEETVLAAGNAFHLPTKAQMERVKKLIGESRPAGEKEAKKKAEMKLRALKNPILQRTA